MRMAPSRSRIAARSSSIQSGEVSKEWTMPKSRFHDRNKSMQTSHNDQLVSAGGMTRQNLNTQNSLFSTKSNMVSTTNTKWNNYDGFYSVVTPQKNSNRVDIVVE